MPKLVIELSKEDLAVLRKVWKFNRENLSPAALAELGWASMGEFCKDLVYFGFDKASDDPVAFIRGMREYKSPVFRTPRAGPRESGMKFEDEFKKAYR